MPVLFLLVFILLCSFQLPNRHQRGPQVLEPSQQPVQRRLVGDRAHQNCLATGVLGDRQSLESEEAAGGQMTFDPDLVHVWFA